jgi:hypothetical protein
VGSAPGRFSSEQADGVDHPEMAMSARTSILVGVDETDDGVPAEFKIGSMLHEAAIELLDSSPVEPESSGRYRV